MDDQTQQLLQGIKPRWVEDGLGIRGNPTVLSNARATPEFELATAQRMPQPEPMGTDPLPLEGGGGGGKVASTQPFQLVDASNATDGKQIRIMASTLGGGSSTDLYFTEGDPDPGYILPVSGAGVVYGVITIDESNGTINSRSLGKGTWKPVNTNTAFYVEIGTYSITGTGGTAKFNVHNSRYGPIGVQICRNYGIASGDPKWSVNFI